MNPVFLKLGNLEIKWYSILILLGVFLGIFWLLHESKKFSYPKDFIFNLAFWAILFGFIGARIYYVIFNWNIYASNPISIFEIWEGGLAIHGGIIAGAITIICYCRKYSINFVRIFDMIAPCLLLGQAIGRWGNFFNMEAHGSVVSKGFLEMLHLPQFIINGMNINGIYYHPTFLYESIWCILGIFIILLLRRFKYLKVGMQTCAYFIWYSIGRFFIESLRTDSLMLGGFKVAQIISICLFLGSLVYLIILCKKGKYEQLYYERKQKE